MRFLLDTCVISEMAKPIPRKAVLDWIAGCDEHHLYLSVLTLGEIQKGIARLPDGRRKATIQQWLDRELRGRFAERILPISDEVAVIWGLISGEASGKGKSLPVVDGLLAATAITHNLTLATRNEDDVSHTGVRIFNPWA